MHDIFPHFINLGALNVKGENNYETIKICHINYFNLCLYFYLYAINGIWSR